MPGHVVMLPVIAVAVRLVAVQWAQAAAAGSDNTSAAAAAAAANALVEIEIGREGLRRAECVAGSVGAIIVSEGDGGGAYDFEAGMFDGVGSLDGAVHVEGANGATKGGMVDLAEAFPLRPSAAGAEGHVRVLTADVVAAGFNAVAGRFVGGPCAGLYAAGAAPGVGDGREDQRGECCSGADE